MVRPHGYESLRGRLYLSGLRLLATIDLIHVHCTGDQPPNSFSYSFVAKKVVQRCPWLGPPIS
jgi:hypothetical protein